MSSPFGIPPPPPSQFGSGRAATAVAAPPQPEPVQGKNPKDPDRWRRRGAITLTFVAIGLLVFANLAVWLHFSAFGSARSNAVATATFDDIAPPIFASLNAPVTEQVKATAVKALGPNATVDEARLGDLSPRVARAVQAAVVSEAFRAEWRAAVNQASARQLELGRGATPTAAEAAGVLITVPTAALGPMITTDLARGGYTYMSGVKLSLPPYTIVTTDSAANHQGAIALGDLWWLFLLGAIVLGGAAIYLADRRLRLATIMAADAALMLLICLLIVPLLRQVVDDQAVNAAQAPWLLSAYDAVIGSLITQTLVLVVIAVCTAIGLGVLTRNRRQRERLEPAA